jgi:ABC-type transport system involved in multi-copper enzyme maturation permease subunit
MRQRLGLAAALLGVGNLAAAFAALTGVLLVTGEYRYGTIRPTFLFNPSRGRVVAAKLAASLLAGLAVGIVSEMLSFVIGVIVLAGRMVPLELSTSCLASSRWLDASPRPAQGTR